MSLILKAGVVILVLTHGRDALASIQMKITKKHLMIAAMPWPPFVIMTEDADGKVQVEGAFWEPIKFWLHVRNFTYTVVRPSDGIWGVCSEPNNCTGLIGMVNTRKVDFALGNYHII